MLDENLELLAMFLHSQLLVAMTALPIYLLKPVLAAGQWPPKHIHKRLHALASPHDDGLGPVCALGTVDPLRSGLEFVQRNAGRVLQWCISNARVC
jgi:hypothetical protein